MGNNDDDGSDGAGDGPPDAELKAHLHLAFDGQIPNFGSYNLVFAAGRAGEGGSFVLGFRRQPLEVVVAPLLPKTLTELEPATSVNLTNVSHLAEVRSGGYEVGTSTGRVFRFEVADEPSVELGGRHVPLQQSRDAADFRDFMDEFMTMLDGFDEAATP